MRIIYIISIIIILLSCTKNNPSFYTDKTTIINNFVKEKKVLKKLLQYPVEIKISPSNSYAFIYSKGIEASNDVYDKFILNETFKIDGFTFNKGIYNWWFIYNIKNNKISFGGNNLVLFDSSFIWDEKRYCLLVGTGIPPNTSKSIIFYNCNENNSVLDVYYENERSYKFSNDLKEIAYLTVVKMDEESGVLPLSIGIKIREIGTNEDILIKSSKDDGFLEIVKWESDNVLLYKEKDSDILLKYEIK